MTFTTATARSQQSEKHRRLWLFASESDWSPTTAINYSATQTRIGIFDSCQKFQVLFYEITIYFKPFAIHSTFGH